MPRQRATARENRRAMAWLPRSRSGRGSRRGVSLMREMRSPARIPATTRENMIPATMPTMLATTMMNPAELIDRHRGQPGENAGQAHQHHKADHHAEKRLDQCRRDETGPSGRRRGIFEHHRPLPVGRGAGLALAESGPWASAVSNMVQVMKHRLPPANRCTSFPVEIRRSAQASTGKPCVGGRVARNCRKVRLSQSDLPQA